jgi:hypothetical protein
LRYHDLAVYADPPEFDHEIEVPQLTLELIKPLIGHEHLKDLFVKPGDIVDPYIQYNTTFA